MQTRPRWMNSLLTEAEACKTRMPWERGLRRQAFIARRASAQAARGPAVSVARAQPDAPETDAPRFALA